MSDIVNLAEYKAKKEKENDEEINELAERVKALVDSLDLEDLHKPYYSASIFPPDTYDSTGMMYYQGTVLTNSVSSCCSTLGSVSYMLVSLGKVDEANAIDEIIDKLEKGL